MVIGSRDCLLDESAAIKMLMKFGGMAIMCPLQLNGKRTNHLIIEENSMKKLITLAILGFAFAVSASAFAGAQQDKMKGCNAEAKADAKAAAAAPSSAKMKQQDKMKSCNAEAKAKALNGDERKKFMSTCLKN